MKLGGKEFTLSRLMTGFQNWFCSLWKYLTGRQLVWTLLVQRFVNLLTSDFTEVTRVVLVDVGTVVVLTTGHTTADLLASALRKRGVVREVVRYLMSPIAPDLAEVVICEEVGLC